MTRGGQIVMAIVSSLAGGLALVLIPPAFDDGYARLFLVVLAIVYAAVALLIYVLDRSFRSARARISR